MYERNINFYQKPGKLNVIIFRYIFRGLRIAPFLIMLYATANVVYFHQHSFLIVLGSVSYVALFVTFITFDQEYLFSYETITKDKESIILEHSRKDGNLKIFCERILPEREFIQREWIIAENHILAKNYMRYSMVKKYVKKMSEARKSGNVIDFKR